MKDAIVTWGENDSVGKKMLRDYLNTLRGCRWCHGLFKPVDAGDWECKDCKPLSDDEKLRWWGWP